MAKIISVDAINDPRGSLVVLQKQIPFEIKRLFYIYGVPEDAVRGGHRHKKTNMVLVCLHGNCQIDIDNGEEKTLVTLDSPTKCLLVEPRDFHFMRGFSHDACLLVIASTEYDKNDYIFESYKHD